MEPEQFVSLFREERISAILRTDDQERAASAMRAAVDGGFRIIEFTLTTPGVFELIAEFSKMSEVVVGAGTVMSVDEARSAVEAGASFLVSPVVDEPVITAASELGVAMMPGVNTPTELLRAHRAGASLQKLFPAPAGGPTWVRSVLGPMPFLRIVPTNGVDAANLRAWVDAGIHAAGFVATLFDKGELAAGNFDAVRARAEAIVAARDALRAA